MPLLRIATALLLTAPGTAGPPGARVAGRIGLPTFVPEGLAVDARTGRTFVGSLRHGGIARLVGARSWRWFVKPRQDASWGFAGLKVDAARRRLWAVSNARPSLKGFAAAEAGRSAVFVFDSDTGRLRRRVEIEGPGPRFLNDLALTEDGGAWVTDSEAGGLWRIPPEGPPAFLATTPALDYPNGLVLARDGRGLLVAVGSGSGLCRVGFDGGVAPVPGPPGESFLGLDGLTRHGDLLLAVHNGHQPGRILALRLDAGESAVAEVRVLHAGPPPLNEVPTTGDLRGTRFRFIANSLIDRFRPDGSLAPGPASPPRILELDLQP